jgi:hypothetical protein
VEWDIRERDIRKRDMGERHIGESKIGERGIGKRNIRKRDIGEWDIRETVTLANIISMWAECLRQSGRAPSEPSETPRWRITPRLASIPRVALHITLRSPFWYTLASGLQ